MSTIETETFTEEQQARLRKKYFPHAPWTEDGPVRRRYLVRAAQGEDVFACLAALAEREDFLAAGQRAITGDPEETLAAFRARESDPSISLVFGYGAASLWCDLALEEPDADGWQTLLIRSEEGENLIALAHARGALRFRRA